MKILVTGTAGFIGYHLALRLLERGDEVIGIDSINDYYDVRIKYGRLRDSGIHAEECEYNQVIQSKRFPGYRFLRLNLEDYENLSKLFAEEKFDRVCNLAAQAGVRYSLINPFAYLNSNFAGFLNIIEASRHNGVQHLVYASSSSVYGLNTEMPFSIHHNVDHPISLYAASKKSNELVAHSYAYLFQLPVTGLRFFTVYGPWGRPDMALFLFTKAILNDEPIEIFNNGNLERDFTFVDDIVEGIVRVLDHPPAGNPAWQSSNPDPATSPAPYHVYNIGNSAPVPLMTFIETIENQLGRKAKKVYLPMQPGDVPKTWADTTDMERNLGYKPATPIEVGIKRFIDWYLEFYQIRK
jgi:UDP-glucuronate 4-epimerase